MARGEVCDFDSILENEDKLKNFCTWFWDNDGEKGNNLIDKLNSQKYIKTDSKIRRQHINNGWPYIYGIAFNDNRNPLLVKRSEDPDVEWKYCKVGITEKNTTTGKHNRMETVKKEIKDKTKKDTPGILFVLPVQGSDPRHKNEIEKSVREHIGWPVNKELADHNGFPVPTEWVLTTQAYIKKIKKSISDKKEKTKEECDTGIFKEITEFSQEEESLNFHRIYKWNLRAKYQRLMHDETDASGFSFAGSVFRF